MDMKKQSIDLDKKTKAQAKMLTHYKKKPLISAKFKPMRLRDYMITALWNKLKFVIQADTYFKYMVGQNG